MVKENNRLITEEKELATIMNTFFVNVTESLDLKKDDDLSLNAIDSENINDTRARSLVVSGLRSETKGSRFESGC